MFVCFYRKHSIFFFPNRSVGKSLQRTESKESRPRSLTPPPAHNTPPPRPLSSLRLESVGSYANRDKNLNFIQNLLRNFFFSSYRKLIITFMFLLYCFLSVMLIINKDIPPPVAMMHGIPHRIVKQKTQTWRMTHSSQTVMLVARPPSVHDYTTPSHGHRSRGEQPFLVQQQDLPSALIRWVTRNLFCDDMSLM